MRIVFVCDKFSDKAMGGSELSIQTHINSCPFPFEKILSKEFNPRRFNPRKEFLVFGNFFEINRDCLPDVAERFRYVVEECDYKYCTFRSRHKHEAMGEPCNCAETAYGKTMFFFIMAAKHVFWKSERQRAEYGRVFNASELGGTIMGGVFSDADIDQILYLRGTERDEKYFVLYSGSWIKGTVQSLDFCRKMGFQYREVGNIPYWDALKEMARSKGIVYMPRGFDVSCRMITEAKLLGIEIHTNDLVQHMTEKWFNGTQEEMVTFLRSRDPEFWRITGELAK